MQFFNYKKILFVTAAIFCLPFFVLATNEVTLSQNTTFALLTSNTAASTTIVASSGGQVTYIDARSNYIDLTLDTSSSITFTTSVGGQYLKVTKQSGSTAYTVTPTCPTTSAVLTGTGATVIVRVQVQTTNPCSSGGHPHVSQVIPPVVTPTSTVATTTNPFATSTVATSTMPLATSTATSTQDIATTTDPFGLGGLNSATSTVGTSSRQGGIGISGGLNRFIFEKNLTIGSKNIDVQMLQLFLNLHGFKVAQTGPGSFGNETNYFGVLTRAAVSAYQKAKGIVPTAGYFGPITRGVVNKENR